MKYNLFEVNVEVNDVITPSSCSAMVIEFIKYIIYQKQLIPYPYERLKMYVLKRKKQLENTENDGSTQHENTKFALVSDKHFMKTEEAYNILENIFQVVTEELTQANHDRIEEVVLLLGTSFLNPQEVFRLRIPSLNYAHLLKFHSTKKNCRNLFRTMFKSEQFQNLVSNTNCTSGLHIMLKMKPDQTINFESFIPRAGFNLPDKGNHTIINFNSEHPYPDCSCDFQIFEDSDVRSESSQSTLNFDQPEDETCTASSLNENDSWFQLKHSLRRLTEAQFQGVAVTDLWMNPNLFSEQNS